jgi:RimJ/RimL family protein N-acetyltransferase
MEIQTKSLKLVAQTREEVLAWLEQLPAADKVEISATWLALLEASSALDPWIHGFVLVHRGTGSVIGKCGFKGPPGAGGVVEIAYGLATEHQGKGYATEAAEALVGYAFGSGEVSIVCAHTLPEPNASTRVLTKCGFRKIGEVIDPEDGLVWRWERTNPTG